jgi:hypothetical protein
MRQEALRKWIFALAGPGSVDFDVLYDKVLVWHKSQPTNRS